MRFRYDPGQCEEIKSRFEGDKACPAGQYRLGQYLTPHGTNATNVCIDVPADTACDVGQYREEADGDCFDVPADTSADLQTAQTALAAANTAAVELAAEVEADKEIAADTAAYLAAELAAEVEAEKEIAAENAAELAAELAAEVEAEKGIAAEIAAEVKEEKDALVLALATQEQLVVQGKIDLQTAEAALAASVANTCGGVNSGQYREEAGGDCKSVDERLWAIIEDQQDQIPGVCGRTRRGYNPNA